MQIYDDLSEYYDLLSPDPERGGEKSINFVADLLREIPRGGTVLDAACGTGVQALALAKRGYRVTATDASEGMLERASLRFREYGVDIRTSCVSWQDLNAMDEGPFGAVFCLGNSLCHCLDADALSRAVQGFFHATAPGGFTAISTRNWELHLEDDPHYWVQEGLDVDGRLIIPVYIWTLNGMGNTCTVDVVFIIHGEETTYKAFPLDFRPFAVGELGECMRQAGFTEIDIRYIDDDHYYYAVGRKPG